MFKHILLLVGLSVAAIFFQHQLLGVLHFLTKIHEEVGDGLELIFSKNTVGEVVQSVFALLLIPVVIGVLVSIAHFFMKQEHFPHTFTVVWVSWAILLAGILAENGRVSDHVLHNLKSDDTEQAAPKLGDQQNAGNQKKLDNQEKSNQSLDLPPQPATH